MPCQSLLSALILLLSLIGTISGDVLIRENVDIPLPTLDDLSRILKRIEDFLVSQPLCAAPFEAFHGLCLSFTDQELTWKAAEAICAAKGGHLVWMQSREEHIAINKFFLMKNKKEKGIFYFWTGLHRSQNGSHTWSNGAINSTYRGSLFIRQGRPFVLAFSENIYFAGVEKDAKWRSICRQANNPDGKEFSLASLLLKNQMAITSKISEVAKSIDRLNKKGKR